MLIASFLAKDPLAALFQDKSLKCYSTGSKRLVQSEVVRVSGEHPTLGYKKVAAKLRSLGYRANKKML